MTEENNIHRIEVPEGYFIDDEGHVVKFTRVVEFDDSAERAFGDVLRRRSRDKKSVEPRTEPKSSHLCPPRRPSNSDNDQ